MRHRLENEIVDARVGCNVRLPTKQQTGQYWVANKFVEEHYHTLTTPNRVYLLRSHRNVSHQEGTYTIVFSNCDL